MLKNNLFSNLLAILALCISLIALGFAINEDEQPIIFGTSNSVHHMIEDNEKQLYVLSIPMEFHNSSNTAVSLKRFSPSNLLTFEKEINYKLFLSNIHLGSVPSLWIKQLKKEEPFDASKSIDHIIRAKQSYKFNMVILINDFEHIQKVKGKINFQAQFSNAQTISVEQDIVIGE